MALGDPYATTEQLEARLTRVDDGAFGRLLDAASRSIESFTRRQFNRSEGPTFRRYRALDPERVPVHDFYTLDDMAVEVGGVAWDVSTTIDARPWSIDGPISWPEDFYGEDQVYTDLFAIGRSFPWSRRGLVAVQARWGWPSVPALIVEATLDAAEVLSLGGGVGNQSTTSAFLKGETISGYSYTYGGPPSLTATRELPPWLAKVALYQRKRFGIA